MEDSISLKTSNQSMRIKLITYGAYCIIAQNLSPSLCERLGYSILALHKQYSTYSHVFLYLATNEYMPFMISVPLVKYLRSRSEVLFFTLLLTQTKTGESTWKSKHLQSALRDKQWQDPRIKSKPYKLQKNNIMSELVLSRLWVWRLFSSVLVGKVVAECRRHSRISVGHEMGQDSPCSTFALSLMLAPF